MNEIKKVFKDSDEHCKICGCEITGQSYVRTENSKFHNNCYFSMQTYATLKEISRTIKNVKSYHAQCPWSNHSFRRNAEPKIIIIPEHSTTPEYFEFIHSRGNLSPLLAFGYRCSTCGQLLEFEAVDTNDFPVWSGD